MSESPIKHGFNPGDTAPNFSLWNTEEKKIELDILTKNFPCVVLVFFPFAFKNTPPKILRSIRDNHEQLEKFHTKIVGISVDTLWALRKYREEEKIPFELLSDFNKNVIQLYDVSIDMYSLFGMKGVSYDALFIIGSGNKRIIEYRKVIQSAADKFDFEKVRLMCKRFAIEAGVHIQLPLEAKASPFPSPILNIDGDVWKSDTPLERPISNQKRKAKVEKKK
ncbi:unnamed protein product [Didymodactylos carnosus]|uniref:Alkyl hydroperoxide reductase subunit C/ Thiol specific antioxidant domain-containing protein n=1 Tax=Didymodactylos carnosus TaxID=1234261 RepID=A0A813Z182_9BILA|nr:unnamed protein product [Didymodactylos carnosus]CAF1001219.1 unnamed protein product [Didymodactylos carnosus]CAF3675982.1 unnamed protein product [Didymodactylos carnosus]CAF3770609.1 unnamed protein product [Didymodactylos carnosus]